MNKTQSLRVKHFVYLVGLHIYRLRIFDNRVLRKIFGYKRDKLTGNWRKLHNEKLYGLYCSPNIIRMIKSRRMIWTGHLASVRDRGGAYRV